MPIYLEGGGGVGNWSKYPLFKERYGDEAKHLISIRVFQPERWNQYLEMEPKLAIGFALLFRNVVAEAHKYLIRVTPYDTGKLRGGWTSYLDKKHIDYSAAFMDTSLIETRSTVTKSDMVNEGKALSSFSESDKEITVTNSVQYGQYLEYGTSRMQARYFTRKAMYKAEYIFAKAMESWIREMASAGDITIPQPISEGMTA